MRRGLAVCVVASLLAAAAVVARSQQGPPDIDATKVHVLRGKLAWRRAVWRVGREGFERVVDELEKARKASDGKPDVTNLYLLGFAYLRLGRLAEADPALADARQMAPDFPGLLLTDALRITAEESPKIDVAIEKAKSAIAIYDEYIARIEAYPKDEAFAAELRFLGYFWRGRTEARLPATYDRAIADLNKALAVAKESGEQAPADVVALLADMHQSLEQSEEAKKLVGEVLSRDPGQSQHYYNLGLLLSRQHDESAARVWFESALARRPDFVEAHMKLAYVMNKLLDPAGMRPHLDAALSITAGRERAGAPPDVTMQADLACGFGSYWKLVGDKRTDAGDETGAIEAYRKAMEYFRQALSKAPGSRSALNHLIQLGDRTNVPADELDGYKRQLDDINRRNVDPHRSTFC